MRYNPLGRSGLQVSAIGLGNWNTAGVKIDEAEALAVLHAAREAGINFLDTADTYGQGQGEAILGNFLSQIDRDEMVVATKMFFPTSADPNDRGLSRKHIFAAVQRALRRLRTDHLDLLQCHRFDAQTPLDETVRAMDDLIRQGKVLYWGVCRFSESQLVECRDQATQTGAPAPISNQHFYNLLERGIESATLGACRALGIGLVGYSPLAQGVLTGKYLGGNRPDGSRGAHARAAKDMWQLQGATEPVVARLAAVADRHGLPLATLALAWCLRLPGLSAVLTGAALPDQIRANAAAAELVLSAELLADIDAALAAPPVSTEIPVTCSAAA
ncbi:MAG: aldo/keto reductase [Planctomycetaceae bacterium]|nr:aldo/keto reductase [Planctomycetaceae bacterium]